MSLKVSSCLFSMQAIRTYWGSILCGTSWSPITKSRSALWTTRTSWHVPRPNRTRGQGGPNSTLGGMGCLNCNIMHTLFKYCYVIVCPLTVSWMVIYQSITWLHHILKKEYIVVFCQVCNAYPIQIIQIRTSASNFSYIFVFAKKYIS